MSNLFEPQQFGTNPVSVEAMQLVIGPREGENNANQIALWCNGTVCWRFSNGVLSAAYITFNGGDSLVEKYVGLEHTAYASDWVVKHTDSDGFIEFVALSDKSFRLRHSFLPENWTPPETCSHCLADPMATPQGHPGEKLCPECGARYSGQKRTLEYETLHAAGLVKAVGAD